MTTLKEFRDEIEQVASVALVGDPLADALQAVLAPDSTLDDLVFLLRKAGTTPVEQIDASPYAAQTRLQTVCWLVAKQISERFDAETRCAPPAALAEVVRDAAKHCAFEGCLNYVMPWQHEFCSDDCERDDMRERGA